MQRCFANLANLKYKGFKMNKTLFAFIITIGLSMGLYAAPNNYTDDRRNIKPMSEKKIKKLDHRYTKHKAVKRDFRTKKDFQRRAQRRATPKHNKNYNKPYNQYDNGRTYRSNNHYTKYRHNRQRAYNRSNRGWILAYRYDRASFYDNEGFYYGYFNRYGYYFEDVFYSYDRYYGYQDRVRGRGLFDRRYYMPVEAREYGFCETQHNPRNYERY